MVDSRRSIGDSSSCNKKGFTLIELVIVGALILILVAISTPLFIETFRGMELEDTAYNIAKIIKYAQQRAILGEKTFRLAFDFDKSEYRLLMQGEEGEAGLEDIVWEKAAGRFGRRFYLPEGVGFKGEADKIDFFAGGRCDKISIYVTNQQGKSFVITTNGRAGYVSVSETDAGETDEE